MCRNIMINADHANQLAWTNPCNKPAGAQSDSLCQSSPEHSWLDSILHPDQKLVRLCHRCRWNALRPLDDPVTVPLCKLQGECMRPLADISCMPMHSKK